MAAHPIWRGHLRLALVSCPIALYSANHDRGSLHFNLINPKTHNRIRMITQDAETGETLSRNDLVKGYEFKKGSYLIVDDDDFESARIESSSTIKIEKFVEANSIDPIYFAGSYYLAPDGDSGEDVYVVLRDAIAGTGRIALSRVVIARREHPIAIMPMGRGLVVHTLHEERDLNDHAGLFDHLPTATPDPDMIKLATQLIERQSGTYNPADMEDRYETRLRAMIEAKLKGEGIKAADPDEPDRGNVIDLMAALKNSLGTPSGEEPAPAPAASKKPVGKNRSPVKTPSKAKSGEAPAKKSSSSAASSSRRRA